MKTLKNVGFFRELEHGSRLGDSLLNCISERAIVDEDKIINYLNNGILLCASCGIVDDYINVSKKAIASPDILTDGCWVWPGDLAYYLEKYHVVLPVDFLLYMEANNWCLPSPDSIDVEDLEMVE